MIPKRIHYCWFGGGPKTELMQHCMDTWPRILPDYEIKEWNEGNFALDTAYTRDAHSRGLWSRLSNYVRLHALMNEGGIYLDTDVEMLKSFDPLLADDCFLGFQLEQRYVDWVNLAVFGSRGENVFLKRCMELTVELYNKEGKFFRGPTVTTMVLKEMGLREYGLQEIGGVKLYPREYFYPYSWRQKYSPECIGEDTYCIHHWAGSWLPKPSLFRRFWHFLTRG